MKKDRTTNQSGAGAAGEARERKAMRVSVPNGIGIGTGAGIAGSSVEKAGTAAAVVLAALIFILASLSATAFAAGQRSGGDAPESTLSEGLWKEFVEKRPDEAAPIYKRVAEPAGAPGDGEAARKAAARLAALGGVRRPAPEASLEVALVACVKPHDIFGRIFKNRSDYDKCLAKFNGAAAAHIREGLARNEIYMVYAVSFGGEVTAAGTDIILCFYNDATVRPNGADERIAGVYNAFNIDFKTVLLTASANLEEAQARYGQAGLIAAGESLSAGRLKDAVLGYVGTGKHDSCLMSVRNASKLAALLGAGEAARPADANEEGGKGSARNGQNGDGRVTISFGGDRLVALYDCSADAMDGIAGAIEKLAGITILPLSVMPGSEYGYSHAAKLADRADLVPAAMRGVAAAEKAIEEAGRATAGRVCIGTLRKLNSVAALYEMEHKDFKKDSLKTFPVERFVTERYLKASPVCPDGGKYMWNGREYLCDRHGASTRLIEFKIAVVENGKEKVISQPKIMTLLYSEAMITIGSSPASPSATQTAAQSSAAQQQAGSASSAAATQSAASTSETNVGKTNDSPAQAPADAAAEQVGFFKLAVKLSKDAGATIASSCIADLDISVTLRSSGRESFKRFKSKLSVSEGSSDWLEIPTPAPASSLKIYMKIK